ncbi:MAG: metallophosphoesterase [Anaerolineales bacterium]|uniref:Metallophosphoesterase n=1 Tax=Candidatus Desulfolinea nitratireducens TaxID=2841698 RepID=A0A8J6NJQ6_9CHLR|nr:metallophosphoesterase [Candidatus Desulfolinea nitratireducens]
MKLYFATDVHGSEICWKKFINAGKFYEADVLILGGDMTGKAIIPIIAQGKNKYKVTLLDQESILDGQENVNEMVKTIQNRGYYPYVTTPEEVKEISTMPGQSDKVFLVQVINTVQRWMDYADEKLAGTGMRCYVCPGNDDMFEIDDLIKASKHIELVEGKLIHLDEDHEMINSGWTNPTPWDTHREEDDETLLERIEIIASQLQNPRTAIFNLHAPPFGSGLDEAPELTEDLHLANAGQSLVPVGSEAVLKLIKKYKPLLGLFGHIHEGKGIRKYHKTLCINPGSMYEQGILQGALINLKPKKIGTYMLTTG